MLSASLWPDTLLWRCCGGEAFVRVPGCGLAHLPSSCSTEADGLEARMVLHAFLVPCTATNGEVEYQMIGPLGGSRAELRTSTQGP